MSKKYIQTLELKSDPKLIDFYVNAHKPSNIWPEIVEGIKAVGIEKMEIYLKDTRLGMIIRVPDHFDFKSAMDKMSTLDRQQEWEEYVGKAQACEESSTSAGKWQLMEKIFSLSDCDTERP